MVTTLHISSLNGCGTDRKGALAIERHDNDESKQIESAHVCPQCGTPILIENIGLREMTTGIITCPKCDWSGKINIQIVRNASAS
jgi:ribosomal protein L37AE/L43A